LGKRGTRKGGKCGTVVRETKGHESHFRTCCGPGAEKAEPGETENQACAGMLPTRNEKEKTNPKAGGVQRQQETIGGE